MLLFKSSFFVMRRSTEQRHFCEGWVPQRRRIGVTMQPEHLKDCISYTLAALKLDWTHDLPLLMKGLIPTIRVNDNFVSKHLAACLIATISPEAVEMNKSAAGHLCGTGTQRLEKTFLIFTLRVCIDCGKLHVETTPFRKKRSLKFPAEYAACFQLPTTTKRSRKLSTW